jgi:predicted dehydrogenase
MTSRTFRWGILGTAQIAKKNWAAIGHSGNSTLVAVGSRTGDRAREFIAEGQQIHRFDPAPAACGSYEELLGRPDVDGVYIPLPTRQRGAWCLRAAQAGKHVLSEKPGATSLAELEAIVGACRRHDLQYMDGVMFMHSPRLPDLRRQLDDREGFGDLRHIASAFSFHGDAAFFGDNIRVDPQREPLGCLGDLGWYNLRFTLWAMNWEQPVEATGRILSTVALPDGTRSACTSFSGELIFRNGVSSSFYCAFQTAHEQWAVATGAKSRFEVPDFVVPDADRKGGSPTNQETYMIRNFATLAASGKPDAFWPDIALRTQSALMDCFQDANRAQPVPLPASSGSGAT